MKFILVFLLAINLSVEARHIGNRFRRDEKHQSETTTVEKNDDFTALLLRNLIVGPPAGAPHITLNVNSKIDESQLDDLLKNSQIKDVREKVDEGEPKKLNEEKKDEAVDNKGSNPPKEENNSAKSDNLENNGSDSGDKKADTTANNKDDRSKDTPKESDKSDGSFGEKKPKKPEDATENKKPDDKRDNSNSKPKRSNGETDIGFGYSF